MLLSPHFALHEFASPVYLNATGKARAKDKLVPPRAYHASLRRLCIALEIIRDDAGGHPLAVVSGWRTEVFNRRSKGRATHSQHLYGRAADLMLTGSRGSTTTRQTRLFFAIQELQRAGRIPKGGLAFYPGRYNKKRKRIEGCFVHYDIRGRNARWRSSPKKR